MAVAVLPTLLSLAAVVPQQNSGALQAAAATAQVRQTNPPAAAAAAARPEPLLSGQRNRHTGEPLRINSSLITLNVGSMSDIWLPYCVSTGNFDDGHGACSTYASGQENHAYCQYDGALEECPECGHCVSAPAP